MTPTMLLASSTKPAIPAQTSNKDVTRDGRDAARDSRKYSETSNEKKVSDDATLTENRKSIDESGSIAFDQMMAALLNMPAPAQTQPVVTVKPVAHDSIAAVKPEASLRFGTGFSIDPALLVMPQDASSTTLNVVSNGSFSTELLAALTPGTPVPVTTDQAISSIPVTVPVPVTTEAVTPELTVATDIEADPRLIAAGFNPTQMTELKDKIEKHANPQTASSVPGKTLYSGEEKPAVITVTFSPEKPPAQTVAPTTNAAVIVAAQAAATSQSKTAIPIAGENIASMESVSMSPDTPVEGENFDPVEFRIAQSFQRPVSTPANPENKTLQTFADTAQAPQTTVTTNAQANAVNPSQSETAMKGKATGDTGLASSFAQSIQMTTAGSFDTLTVNPAVAPTAVTQSLTSPVVQSASASQSHPAIQTVAAVIAKNAKEGGPQTLSLRLDPPELGKLQVQMKYKKGDPLKVHVVLEKADTAAMLQRDSHALESALKDAGLQTDGSSLSFELSQDGNAFNQAMGQDGSGSRNSTGAVSKSSFEDLPPLETSMDIFTDNKTGLTHYNLRV